MNNHDDVNTPVIAAIGLVAILLLVAFVLFLQVVYYQADTQQEADGIILQPPRELIDLKPQQQARLASYAWVDAKKGTVAIPIDRAMTQVLTDLARTQRSRAVERNSTRNEFLAKAPRREAQRNEDGSYGNWLAARASAPNFPSFLLHPLRLCVFCAFARKIVFADVANVLRPSSLLAAACVILAMVVAAPARAAEVDRKERLPPELEGVGVTPHPNARLPLDLAFVDSDGRNVTLGQFFDGKRPVILTMNYSSCPRLCSLQLHGLLGA